MTISDQLSTLWFYKRNRLLRSAEEVGPVSDEQFLTLINHKEIDAQTEVRSPQLTEDKYVLGNLVPISTIQELVEQRKAEQQRLERRAERKREIDSKNRQKLVCAIELFIADGTVSFTEKSKLLEFGQAAGIPTDEIESLLNVESSRLINALIENILEDGFLDPQEKDRLSQVATGLGVSLAFSADQLKRFERSELAWQLATGNFRPPRINVNDFSANSNESIIVACSLEWFEIVQQKKPSGIPLGDDHYLKSTVIGECVLTDKRIVMISKFSAKKINLSSVEAVRWYRDGVFCKRSSGKSIFLRPTTNSSEWDRFAMLVQHAITGEPVLGTEPTQAFIPPVVESNMGSSASPPILNRSGSSTAPNVEWQPTSDEPRYTFRVVGDQYEGRSQWIDRLNLGDPVSIIREPSNPYDENAVAVFDTNRHQIGYLKREVAAWFAQILDRGRRFRCEVFRRLNSGSLIIAVYE